MTDDPSSNVRVFALFRACVLAFAVTLLMATRCPAQASRGDLEKVDRLLLLMKERLTLMHDVACRKWNANQPIAAPKREQELLDSVVRQGRAQGLDPKFVRSFFEAQIEAAKVIEQTDFDRWKGDKQKPSGGTSSLAELRRRIDELNRGLLKELAELYPALSNDAVQKELPRRAAVILAGDDLALVRKTAIGPLCH